MTLFMPLGGASASLSILFLAHVRSRPSGFTSLESKLSFLWKLGGNMETKKKLGEKRQTWRTLRIFLIDLIKCRKMIKEGICNSC